VLPVKKSRGACNLPTADQFAMKILFLDQSGKPGGAELCLLDIAKHYRDRCLVALFADGTFREQLEANQIPVQVLTTQAINVRKGSNMLQGFIGLGQLAPVIVKTVQLARSFDVIYANTQKALVVGAIAHFVTHRPLVYHLHDILSADHFSSTNQRLIVYLANHFTKLVIANSKASAESFIQAGGDPKKVEIIYNGFSPELYQNHLSEVPKLRQELGSAQQFVVGHFSRLSPWKGQHILLEALQHCPANVVAWFVGDALFGETAYKQQLQQQVEDLGLGDRVRFLGFRLDVPQLMAACDLVAHTSTAPEPFGRVIVEAMLCGTPIVASAAGGVTELIEPGQTGWLTPPGEAHKLAEIIHQCLADPDRARAIAQAAQTSASQRFHLDAVNQQIDRVLQGI